MTNTLAIDPGLDTGWAVVSQQGQLLACGLGEDFDKAATEFSVAHVIIERPQVYLARNSPGDPNDLITLAIRVGRYSERLKAWPVEHVLPREWKGTLDADVCCRRVYKELSDFDKEVLDPVLRPLARRPLSFVTLTEGRRHNVIDAVGLARWSVGSRLAGRFNVATQ